MNSKISGPCRTSNVSASPMRIVHVLPTLGIEASGPVYSVSRLCESLVGYGTDLILAVTDHTKLRSYPGYAKVFPLGPGPRRLGNSSAMARWLTREAALRRVNLIHSHGLWMMPNVYPGWAKRCSPSLRLVISPRGTLSEWALKYHSIRKRLFWPFFQAQCLRLADAFHVTAESEYHDVRRMGFKQPVCIIPNGIDMPGLHQESLTGPPYTVLFLGRVHPIKGVDLLLRAWQLVSDAFPHWRLRIAGPGDPPEYLIHLRRMAERLKIQRVTWLGSVCGRTKIDTYQSANLYVLPSHSENFGLTIAEALASGTPVITTKGTPWGGLQRENAGWWIDIGVEPLAACLRQALSLPAHVLREMGLRGRAWMERSYSWRSIAHRMRSFYEWLLGRGPLPEYVRHD